MTGSSALVARNSSAENCEPTESSTSELPTTRALALSAGRDTVDKSASPHLQPGWLTRAAVPSLDRFETLFVQACKLLRLRRLRESRRL